MVHNRLAGAFNADAVTEFSFLLRKIQEDGRGRRRYALLAALACTTIFILDLATPRGVADGMLYAPVLLIGLWRLEKPFILALTGACIALIFAGWFLSPSALATGAGYPLYNRLLTLFMIGSLALLLLHSTHRETAFWILMEAIEQSSAGIIITDTEGRMAYVNPAVSRLSGWPRDKLIGVNPRIFSSGRATKEDYERLWATILAGETWSWEVVNRRKDGELVWEQETITPVRDCVGRIKCYIGLKENITTRKQLEEKVQLALLAAEEASRAKTVFLANMSHELRTPLNAIIGYSETMKLGIHAPLTHPKHQEYISVIYQSGSFLLQLINDILDLSKMEVGQGTPRLDHVYLPETIKMCLRMVSERANRKQIRLVVDIDDTMPRLIADDLMVKQIVLNLCTNAVKFTPEKGTVTIRALVENSSGDILLHVEDTGIGITPRDMARIFKPFVRAEGDVYIHRQEGTGLGLALVRRLVEAHGGTIILDSKPDIGTVVTVRFPAERVAGAGSAASLS